MNSIYIDCNRNNSSIKSNAKNEWEYKLSTPLNLPPGSQVSVQDTFINKKGISGQSIEILEDITEKISYGYYLSDNPHFVPQAYYNQIDTQGNTAYIDSFVPMGSCNYDITDHRTMDNQVILTDGVPEVYGGFAANQRVDLFARNGLDDNDELGACNPFYNANADDNYLTTADPTTEGYTNTFNRLIDPCACGFTELPMCAIKIKKEGVPKVSSDIPLAADNSNLHTYYPVPQGNNTNDPNFTNAFNGNTTTDFEDLRLEPLIGTTEIFIPKGVYAVSEIAELIEDQLKGTIDSENLKTKDDYYNGTVINSKRGDLDNKGIYKKVKAFNFYGGNEGTGININTANKTDANLPAIADMEKIGSIFNNPYQFSPIYTFEGQNASTDNGINHSNGLTNANAHLFWNGGVLPYAPPIDKITKWNSFNSNYENNNTTAQPPNLNSFCKTSQFPAEDMIMYIPVHRYNQLMKLSKYSRAGYFPFVFPEDPGTSLARYDEDYRKFRYGYQRHKSTIGIQAEYPNESSNGVLANPPVNSYRHWFPFRRMPTYHTRNNQDYKVYFSKDLIGLHTIKQVNTFPQHQASTTEIRNNTSNGYGIACNVPTTIGTYNRNFSYDINGENGYYLGTPDLKFSYDNIKNGFSFENLHQSRREPSLSMHGNKLENEGNEYVELRRPATYLNIAMQSGNNPLITNQTPITGLNDEKNSADFSKRIMKSLSRPSTRVGGIMIYNWGVNIAEQEGDININDGNYTANATQFFKFKDYFTSETKAKEAWKKTIWARLGFTYDNLQNETGFEKVHYYNQANENGVLDENYEDYYNFAKDDFTLYGKTTDANMDISIAPTISTAYAGDKFDIANGGNLVEPKPSNPFSTVRTYDNNDVSTPQAPQTSTLVNDLLMNEGKATLTLDSNYNNYLSSNYQMSATYPVQTTSTSLSATSFPTLSQRGYFLITSDIIDGYRDEIKQGTPMPLLGIIPISNLSNQDFITTKNTIVHSVSQQKIINSIKIKVLNPDLTAPLLEDNSSVIIQVNIPIQQPPQQKDKEGDKKPQPDEE